MGLFAQRRAQATADQLDHTEVTQKRNKGEVRWGERGTLDAQVDFP